jgi:Carboxypeptidase regulatory-like domain/TonB-dependent Receptor Plug Domain
MFAIVLTGNAQRGDLFSKVSASNGALTAATLTGIVVDPNNAVVPDANVSVKDLGATIKREATTGNDGGFIIPQLPPGYYIVAVRHEGFATAEVRDVALKIRDQLALKIQLKIGHIGETVTVKADDSLLRKNPALGLNRYFIEDLPINSRSLQPLIALTPGIVSTKSTFSEQGQFSVNGQRANANYFLVDGVSANIGVAAGADGLGQSGGGSLPGLTALGTTPSLLSLDEAQEVKIYTNAYAAEFGRAPGAQVVITTLSGTNEFRGSVFEYFRNGALGAHDWFANRDGLATPLLNQHNFGGVFGGPLIKDRTFFFVSYEGLRLRLPQVATTEVPSIAARRAAPAQLAPFLNAFPEPNGAETSNGLAKFSTSYSDVAGFNATSIRVDQRIGDKITLFGRFHSAPSETVQRGAGSSLNTSLLLRFRTKTLTVGASANITPRISNDVRVNYSKSDGGKSSLLDDFGGAVVPDDAIFFPRFTSRLESSYSLSFANASFSVGKDSSNFQNQMNLVDNLAIVRGGHQLRFGFDYRRLNPTYGERKYKEITNFNSVAGAIDNATAASVTILSQDEVGVTLTQFTAYGQDDLRVTRRLNLNYGLRWEYNPPPSGKDHKVPFTVLGLDTPSTLTLAPPGTPHYQATFNNFAPRFGVAYQLSGQQGRETVLRGGFGFFYDLGIGPLVNTTVSFPYLRRSVISNVEYPLSPSPVAPLPFTLEPPVGRIRATDPHLKLPLTVQWNITLEQSLGSRQSMSAAYVAAVGRRLLRLESLLNPNPNFSQVFVTTNDATSDYHSLQLQFQRRLSRGLQGLVSYTWSHSIDTASNDSAANVPAARIDPLQDRASSDFDVRHSVNVALSYSIPTLAKGTLFASLLRNWSLDALAAARTATPIDVFVRRDLGFGPFNFRPDLIPGSPLYIEDRTAPGGRRINGAAFVIPRISRQGTLGRNALWGFAFSQIDLAVHRRVPLTDKINLELRAEAFNILNHPNFADPVNDVASSLFGISTSMLGRSLGSNGIGLNPLYQSGGPRSIQLCLRLQF